MIIDEKRPARGNALLAALAPQDRRLIAPHLEEVHLLPRQVVLEADRLVRRAYFPQDCIVSLFTTFESGEGIETATIGPEGVIGPPLFASHEHSPVYAVAQSEGRALTVADAVLRRAMEESRSIRTLFSFYTHAFLAQVLQTAACNAMHSTEKRIAKWLLMSEDRVSGKPLRVTHERLAEMLGVGRPTVSLGARNLQASGLISYRHGQITIIDRAGLENASCPCYRMIRHTYERLLPLTFDK